MGIWSGARDAPSMISTGTSLNWKRWRVGSYQPFTQQPSSAM